MPDAMTSSAVNSNNDLNLVTWTRIITLYRRKLTKHTDVFAALGGIAQVYAYIHEFRGTDCLAGLWLPQMVFGLLWYSNDATFSEELLAPSWSWANLIGGQGKSVRFLVPNDLDGRAEVIHPRVEFLNASLDHTTEKNFAHPSWGCLHAECLLHWVTLSGLGTEASDKSSKRPGLYPKAFLGGRLLTSCDEGDEGVLYCQYRQLYYGPCSWNHFHAEIDVPRASRPNSLTGFFLPLLYVARMFPETPVGAPRPAVGLLLQRLNGNVGTYRRIGILELLAAHRDEPDLQTLPEWQHGATLSPNEYKADLGNGCYEIELA